MTIQSDSSVDSALLANLREEMGGAGSPVFLETIASYLQESQMHLKTLEEAAQEQRVEQIGRMAHLLKGSSGYFGAHRVQALCLKIESMVKTNQLYGMIHHVHVLQEEFRRVRTTLERESAHGPA